MKTGGENFPSFYKGVKSLKKIAIMNNKGGTLKTTTATSIASILSQTPENNVLLVDADGQGNSSVTFGENPVEYYYTLYDLLMSDEDIPLKQILVELKPNLNLLPSNSDLDYLDQDVWSNQSQYPFPFTLLRNALRSKFEDSRTHIIFDASPSMNLVNMNILAYVDTVIIPFEAEETALKGIVKMIDKIEEFRAEYNPKLQIGALLPVKIEARTNLHQQILDEATAYAEDNDIFIFNHGIPKSIKHAESVTQDGLPSVETIRNNRAVQSYYKFTNELIERDVL